MSESINIKSVQFEFKKLVAIKFRTRDTTEHPEILQTSISTLGIASPSKVLEDQVGIFLPPGITQGVMKAAPAMFDALGGMAGKIAPVMAQAAQAAQTAITGSTYHQSTLNVQPGAITVHAAGGQNAQQTAKATLTQFKTAVAMKRG